MKPKPLPEPDCLFGRKRRWKLSSLLEYEASLTGRPAPQIDPIDERYLTAAQVRERYGNVSDMWIWRRLNASRLKGASDVLSS